MEDLDNHQDIKIVEDSNDIFDAAPSKKDEMPDNISFDNSTNYSSGKTSISSAGRIIKNEDMGEVYYPGKSLTEPIWFTFYRDASKIYTKVKFILKYNKTEEELEKGVQNPDVWGPFILCVLLAGSVSLNYTTNKGDAFVQVFMLFWMGSYIINFNNRMLGFKTTVFQMVCCLGYSMFPLNIIAFLLAIFNIPDLIKPVLIILSVVWSIKCK